MEKYSRLFEAKVDTEIDEDDYIEKLEAKNPSFVSLSLSNEERKKLVKLHSSKKYNWKFIIHSTESEKEKEKSESKIKELKKQGWKVFMNDDNMDQKALVLYKGK